MHACRVGCDTRLCERNIASVVHHAMPPCVRAHTFARLRKRAQLKAEIYGTGEFLTTMCRTLAFAMHLVRGHDLSLFAAFRPARTNSRHPKTTCISVLLVLTPGRCSCLAALCLEPNNPARRRVASGHVVCVRRRLALYWPDGHRDGVENSISAIRIGQTNYGCRDVSWLTRMCTLASNKVCTSLVRVARVESDAFIDKCITIPSSVSLWSVYFATGRRPIRKGIPRIEHRDAIGI